MSERIKKGTKDLTRTLVGSLRAELTNSLVQFLARRFVTLLFVIQDVNQVARVFNTLVKVGEREIF